MASIQFDNVCVDFPIFSASGRSLKKRLIDVATGGKLNADEHGHVVIRALENLKFTLHAGDRVGLVGHNGAGKSTLLRLLSGVYEPSSGAARIDGKITSLIDIFLGIDREATGRENIYFRGILLGMSKFEIQKKIEDIIDFADLGDFVDMPLHTYSSGMHLRLAFAVSTITNPEILLMDEWLSVGDEGFKNKAEARLTELVQASNILVIASHSRELLLGTCNRVLWLEHGTIRMDGDAHTVVATYFRSTEKRTGIDDDAQRAAAAQVTSMGPLLLSDAEQATLHDMAVFHRNVNTRTRAQALLRLCRGWALRLTADNLAVSEGQVLKWRQLWESVGVVGLIEVHFAAMCKKMEALQIE